MTRIWIISGMMALSITAAWQLSPTRVADGRATPSLEDMIPFEAGDWRTDETVAPVLPRDVQGEQGLAARIYDRTLVRTYRNSDGERMMLVLAYGRDQSDALQLHLPEYCYASQGFRVRPAGRANVILEDGTGVIMKRLTTQRGPRFEPVTYWARVGDSIALSTLSRQWAKLRAGLGGQVPDGILIRVSMISKDSKHAFDLQKSFLQQLLQQVLPEHRRFLLGERATVTSSS